MSSAMMSTPRCVPRSSANRTYFETDCGRPLGRPQSRFRSLRDSASIELWGGDLGLGHSIEGISFDTRTPMDLGGLSRRHIPCHLAADALLWQPGPRAVLLGDPATGHSRLSVARRSCLTQLEHLARKRSGLSPAAGSRQPPAEQASHRRPFRAATARGVLLVILDIAQHMLCPPFGATSVDGSGSPSLPRCRSAPSLGSEATITSSSPRRSRRRRDALVVSASRYSTWRRSSSWSGGTCW